MTVQYVTCLTIHCTQYVTLQLWWVFFSGVRLVTRFSLQIPYMVKKQFDGKKIVAETVHIETNGKTIKLLRKPRVIKFSIIKMRFADYKINYKSKFSPHSKAIFNALVYVPFLRQFGRQTASNRQPPILQSLRSAAELGAALRPPYWQHLPPVEQQPVAPRLPLAQKEGVGQGESTGSWAPAERQESHMICEVM